MKIYSPKRYWFILTIAVLFVVLSFIFINLNSADADNASGEKILEHNIIVKIPDGVYLYYSTIQNLQTNKVSPLIIVKNGRILNPYKIAKKTNEQKMMKEYAVGVKYNVIKGSEKIGELSNINLENCYCLEKPRNTKQEILPEIIGAGKYNGRELKTTLSSSRIPFGFTNIFIAPPLFNPDRGANVFKITEEEKDKLLTVCREKYLPIIWKEQNEKLAKRGRKIASENKSRLFAVEAVDLSGQGKKDYIGLYNVSYKIVEGNRTAGLSGDEVPFVLWHDGKIERIDEVYSTAEFMFITAIDIDGDGNKELLVQRKIDIEKMHDDGALETFQIEILKHKSSGWISIWQSGLICAPGSFYF